MNRAPIIVALIATFLCDPPFAIAQEVASPIAACIQENAPKVERAISSLPEATDFLIGSVCIAQIAADQREKQQARVAQSVAAQRKICDQKKAAGQPTKIGSSDDGYDPCAMLDIQESITSNTTWITFAGKQQDPDATALAAKTLLAIRLSHSTSGQHN